MPPQSRGSPMPAGFHSKSTPNLPTLRSLDTDAAAKRALAAAATTSANLTLSPPTLSSATGAASIEDFSLEAAIPDIDSGSSSSSEESDNAPISNLPTRPLYHHHSRSHTYLGPSTFAPPFYNRPPTPLPPSPSLTSLLRPAFSTQTSRPTTPDPSSDEGGASNTGTGIRGGGGGGGGGGVTPNSAAAASTLTTSFRSAKPIPRASPKVPTYEYYGFTLYLTSSAAFLIYLLWSFLPSPFLHQLGIYYYPNRWWSLAIPAWLVMLVVWVYVALAAYNTGSLTLGLDMVECLVDEAANVAVVDARGRIIREGRGAGRVGRGEGAHVAGAGGGARKANAGHAPQSRSSSAVRTGAGAGVGLDWASLWNEGTDAVMDVPIGGVCEVLYGEARDEVL